MDENMKVIIYDEDLKALEDAIKYRTGDTHEYKFPDDFIEALSRMKDTLDMLVAGELTEYVCYDEVIVKNKFQALSYVTKRLICPNAKHVDSNAFDGVGLQEIYAPKLESCAPYAFEYCGAVEIHCENLKKLCDSAFSMSFSDSDLYFPRVEIVGRNAFYWGAFERIDLPSVKEMTSGGVFEYGFNGELDLSSLERAGYETFFDFHMSKIYLPKLRIADNFCFFASDIQTAIFPELRELHYQAFRNCTNLKALLLGNTEHMCELYDISAFQGTPIADGDGFIYVADCFYEAYKTATNWSVFANKIRPISEYVEE